VNDHFRDLLRQYFEAKDKFYVFKMAPLEQKLRAAVFGKPPQSEKEAELPA
jgi:hypothetical protein